MNQDAGSRLISAIRKQNEKTIYFCTAENISPNVAVHEIRKSFKRIRALLYFYDELADPAVAKFKQKIKKTGREISALRESFVTLQLFEREILGNKLIAEQKLKIAFEKLDEKNKTLIHEKFESSQFCERIKLLPDDFELYLESSESRATKKHLFEQVILTYEKCNAIYEELPAQQPPKEMHELRKKMKRLWYQFDFLRFLHPRFFRIKTDQLNHISEHLGTDHDLYISLLELKSDYLDFNAEEIQILENLVLHLREVNLVKLNPRLSQFFSEPFELFEDKMRKIFKLD